MGGVSCICFAHIAHLALVAVGGVLWVVPCQGIGGNVGAFAAAWWYWGVVGTSLAAQQRGRRWGGDSGARFAQLVLGPG